MPIELLNHKDAKKELTFGEQMALKHNLFYEIVSAQDEVPRKTLNTVVQEVFENSTGDGMFLAGKYGFTPNEYKEAILNETYILKHEKMADGIVEDLEKVSAFLKAESNGEIDTHEMDEYGANLKRMLEFTDSFASFASRSHVLKSVQDHSLDEKSILQVNKPDPALKLFRDVEDYYVKTLQIPKEIKMEDIKVVPFEKRLPLTSKFFRMHQLANENTEEHVRPLGVIYSRLQDMAENEMVKSIEYRTRNKTAILNPDTDRYELLPLEAKKGVYTEEEADKIFEPIWDQYMQLVNKYSPEGSVILSVDDITDEQDKLQMEENYIKYNKAEDFKHLKKEYNAKQMLRLLDRTDQTRKIALLINIIDNNEIPDSMVDTLVASMQRNGISNEIQQELLDERRRSTPNAEDDKDLLYLNSIHNPAKYADGIERIISSEGLLYDGVSDKQALMSSKTQLNNIIETYKANPALYLAYHPADRDKNVSIQARFINERMFPNELSKYWELINTDTGYDRKFSNTSTEGDSLNVKRGSEGGGRLGGDSTSFLDGNPLEKSPNLALESREAISGLLMSGVYGKFNKEKRAWEKVYFPLGLNIGDPSVEHTCKVGAKYTGKTLLMKPLNADILSERVVFTKNDGTQVNADVVKNSLMEAFVNVPDDVKGIEYSFIQGLAPVLMKSMTESQYDVYKKKFERENGTDMTEKIAEVPSDIQEFLDSLKGRTVEDKVMSIEEYVKNIGYYDFQNKEVQKVKENVSLEEVFIVMQRRMDEIRSKYPSLKDNFEAKKYAGVCADFNKLVAAMMRESGIVSGVATGSVPSGKRVFEHNRHGVAFAVFPDENGKNIVHIVDGTPSGVSEADKVMMREAGLESKSLREKEKEDKAEIEVVSEMAEKEIEEILQTLDSADMEQIAELTNGKLEKSLNVYLRYGVKKEQFQVIKRVLDAYAYSPLYKEGAESLENKLDSIKFLQNEIKGVRTDQADAPQSELDVPSGTLLLQSLQDYARRLSPENKVTGLRTIQTLAELPDLGLTSKEKKSVLLVTKYLTNKRP